MSSLNHSIKTMFIWGFHGRVGYEIMSEIIKQGKLLMLISSFNAMAIGCKSIKRK